MAGERKPAKLTAKQQAFVEAYAGNATEAARIAGYRGSDETIRQVARENLTKPHIQKAIRKRNKSAQKERIADREARQIWWTEVMYDKKRPMKERLRASELLGKSEGDFMQRYEHTGGNGEPITVNIVDEVSPALREVLDQVYENAKKADASSRPPEKQAP